MTVGVEEGRKGCGVEGGGGERERMKGKRRCGILYSSIDSFTRGHGLSGAFAFSGPPRDLLSFCGPTLLNPDN